MNEDQLPELMAAYQQGNLDAFEALYRALKLPLHRYLCALSRHRADADDLLQETFLQLHRSRRTHMPGRPVLPWAFAIARHVFLTASRRRSRLRNREVAASQELPEIPVPPDAERLADYDTLQRALHRLPAEQVEAITLHHVSGFGFEEIGSIVGVRAGTAKLRAFRGLKRLRQILETNVKPEEAVGRTVGETPLAPKRKPIDRG